MSSVFVWIIKVRLPSGDEMAFSSYKKNFALVPFRKGKAKGATCWSSFQAAEIYLKDLRKAAPEIRRLAPFEIIRVKGIQ